MSDTIYALSSAPGRAGVAVVRVSGSMARAVLQRLAGTLPAPRQAALRTLAGADGGRIDQALVVWFSGPDSFTGEDVAELHVHGGRAVLERLYAEIGMEPGVRPAERGEFTRRAVENGKLDLTQAEGLADLIDAETEGQRRQALNQYGGALAALVERWRERLLKTLAWAEAEIDFSDEELPADVAARVHSDVAEILEEIGARLGDRHRGEIVRDGLFLTVIGPPNVGKSSLVNALARRDVAIVAETVGTTRDVVEVRLDIAGYAVIVADTAGLRDAADQVEREGVRRALARAEQSDLTLLLLDSSAAGPTDGLPQGAMAAADLVVWNKADLAPAGRQGDLCISAKTGQGMDALLAKLEEMVAARLAAPREAPLFTRARHRATLEDAAAALRRAREAQESELFAEDLRLALRAIGRITGRVDVEELLDIVFRDFCIGK